MKVLRTKSSIDGGFTAKFVKVNHGFICKIIVKSSSNGRFVGPVNPWLVSLSFMSGLSPRVYYAKG